MTEISKLQLLPAANDPAEKVRLDVPLICEPLPQMSVNGSPLASMPDRAASRSSVKAKPLAAKPLLLLLMVKRRVVVMPGPTISGVNSLLNVGAGGLIVSMSMAAATGATSLLASVLVVLV